MEKLSEKLEDVRLFAGDSEQVQAAIRMCIQLVEAHETEWEKRVAELEQRLRTVAEALRELSPGPHPGPMNAEDYVPLVGNRLTALQDWQDSFMEFSKLATPRIAELEAQNIALTCDMNAFRLRSESLQAQLAWTPVSDGLPTEPGEGETYEFTCHGHVSVLTLSGEIWEDSDGDYLDTEDDVVETYTHFRRIALPEPTT